MKALIVDGTSGDGSVIRKISEAARSLGIDTMILTVKEMSVKRCTGCFGCWVKTPGVCAINDDGRRLSQEWASSDIIVNVTPIFLGSYSPVLKRQWDRLIPNLLPYMKAFRGERHHPQRYQGKKALISFGFSSGDSEEEQTFTKLVKRNGLNIQAKYVEVVISQDLENFNPAVALANAKEALS